MTILIVLHSLSLMFAMSVGNLASQYCRDHKYVSNKQMDVSCVAMKQLDDYNAIKKATRSKFGRGQ